MKFSKEVRTGILVVVTLALSIYGFNYLKGYDIFSVSDEYYAIYTDANGILESNPVLINGMRVGKIQKIYFHPDNSGRVVVRFVLTNTDFKIPKNSIAQISALDLLGAKGLKLIPGNDPEYAKDGDTINGTLEKGMIDLVTSELMPTKLKAENLITTIDSTLKSVNKVLVGGGSNNLKSIIENLKSTTVKVDDIVAEQQKRLSKIMENVESISGNLKDNNKQLSNIIKNFSSISDSLVKSNLKSAINNADKALADLAKVVEKINKGQGSLGMLVNNDSLYKHLDMSAKDLDLLMIDVKAHPKRYLGISVFGGKDKSEKKKK